MRYQWASMGEIVRCVVYYLLSSGKHKQQHKQPEIIYWASKFICTKSLSEDPQTDLTAAAGKRC